jgi:hypothetical protein
MLLVSCKVPKCVDGGQCVELGCLQQYSESMLVNNVKCTCVRVLQPCPPCLYPVRTRVQSHPDQTVSYGNDKVKKREQATVVSVLVLRPLASYHCSTEPAAEGGLTQPIPYPHNYLARRCVCASYMYWQVM